MVATATAAAGITVAPATTASATGPVGYYTAVAAPPLVAAGSSSSYAVRVRNVSLLPVTSVRIAVPAGFTVTALGPALAGDDAWTLSNQTCTPSTPPPCTGAGGTYLQADAPTHGQLPDPLWPLMSVVVSFQASAAVTAGTYTWGTAVATIPGIDWLNLALLGPAPTTTVYANAAASLVVSGLPTGPVTAGTALTPTVTAVDSHGNLASGYRGTVHFALSPAGLVALAAPAAATSTGTTLPGDYTFTAGDAGRHTFTGLTLTGAPAQGFAVTDLADASVTGSATVAITPGPASSLKLTAPPTATAGSSFPVAVTAFDQYGNTATGYTGTVHFTSDDNQTGTQLPGDYTFLASDAGTHGFPVTLTRAGSRTLTVGDGTRSDHAGVQVAPGGATRLAVAGPEGPVTAGEPFDLTVTVSDAFGNLVPGFTGTVHFGSSSDGATLPDDYTFGPADAGSHTFAGGATLVVSGGDTIGVADDQDGLDPASTVVTVTPADATRIAVSGGGHVVAGQPEPFTFSVEDQYGNLVTTSTAPVAFACTGVGVAPGSCPAASQFAGGQVSVSPVLTVAGAQTVTASSTGLADGVGHVVVDPAEAYAVVLTGPGAPVVAGAGFGATAKLVDAYGNLEAGDSGTQVALSIASPVTPFPAGAPTAGGVATFTGLHVTVAGGYVLTAAVTGLSEGAAGLTVLPDASTDHLVVTSAPSASVPAGTPFSLGISVQDQFANTDTTNAVPVLLTSSPTVTGLPATVSTSGGTSTFGPFTLTVPGTYVFGASSSGLPGTSASVTVVPANASRILVTGVADEATSPHLPHPVVGKPFDTTVQFLDAYGNVAPLGSGVTLTLSHTTGTGTIAGTFQVGAPAGASGATIVGSTYSALENAVVLQVSATGGTLTPGSITTDVAGQAATVTGTPNVAIPPINSLDPQTGVPCVLSATQATCSQFVLPKGALNAVYLYQTKCDAGCKTGGGTTAQIVYGTATLTDAGGNALYSRAHPAALAIKCYSTLCPHPDPMPPGQRYDLHELKEDVAANPVEFTVFLPGSKTQTFTAIATICTKAGVVDAGKYFCIDPAKSGRDTKKNYTAYVLFFGDPKGRVT